LYKKHPVLYEKSNTGHPPPIYYLITGLLLLSIAFSFQHTGLMLYCLLVWLACTGWFAWVRLKNATHSAQHITEMICTSAVIPVLSLYWNLYGAIKFKTLYL
jgi:hypothetical protein